MESEEVGEKKNFCLDPPLFSCNLFWLPSRQKSNQIDPPPPRPDPPRL